MGSSGPSLNLDQWNRCRIFSSCWYITRGSWWQEQGWTGKGGKQLGMLNSPISCPLIGQFGVILGSDWLKWLPQKQPLPGPASGGSLCGHTMLDYAATMPVCITCKIGAAPVRRWCLHHGAGLKLPHYVPLRVSSQHPSYSSYYPELCQNYDTTFKKPLQKKINNLDE